MKKTLLFIFVVLLLSTVTLYADPAWPDSVLVHQPDGTDLWVYDRGDEYFHWVESTDGFVIVKNEADIFEYASLDGGGDIRPSGIKVHNRQHKSFEELAYAQQQETLYYKINKNCKKLKREDPLLRTPHIPTAPIIGTRKILTILVGFPDKEFTYTQEDFNDLMNQTGYVGFMQGGSVHDYYYENSYGQLNIESTIIGPFTASQNSSNYIYAQGADATNAVNLVIEAINWADGQGIDFSLFDGNNDGYVDCIHIIFAGNRYSSGGTGIIWPFNSAFITPIVKDGKNISEFIMTPEKLGNNETYITSIGTICHELGHVLGAPDFYPREIGDSNNHLGTGIWDVMGTGTNLNQGYSPPHHNPYTKTAIFQWTNPNTINASETNNVYNIPTSSQNSTAIYKIPTLTTGEYYLLENRQKVSFDRYLPDSGLLIYHIHKDIESAIATNTVNSSLPQMCYLVDPKSVTAIPSGTDTTSYGTPALNIFPANYIDGTTNIFFTSQTTPRSQSWAGDSTGVDICFIQHDGNNIKFVVNPQIEGPSRLSDTTYFSVSNVPEGATCTWTVTPPHYTIGEFTIHNNGTPSICVTRDPQPTPMFNGLNTEQERIIIIPPVPDIGSVDVIISDGNDHSYHISKTLYSGVWFHSNALSEEKKFSYSLELWHSIYGLLRTQNIQSADEQIDTSGLPQGLYIIITKENGQPIKQTKIMIQ